VQPYDELLKVALVGPPNAGVSRFLQLCAPRFLSPVVAGEVAVQLQLWDSTAGARLDCRGADAALVVFDVAVRARPGRLRNFGLRQW
jgi:hypothetical protein